MHLKALQQHTQYLQILRRMTPEQRLAKAIVAEQQYEIQLMQLWLARMGSRTLQESKGVTR